MNRKLNDKILLANFNHAFKCLQDYLKVFEESKAAALLLTDSTAKVVTKALLESVGLCSVAFWQVSDNFLASALNGDDTSTIAKQIRDPDTGIRGTTTTHHRISDKHLLTIVISSDGKCVDVRTKIEQNYLEEPVTILQHDFTMEL